MSYGILFPGQGSQYLNMNHESQCDKKILIPLLEQASTIIGIDLERELAERTMKDLTQAEIAQPAILVFSYALFLDFKQQNKSTAMALLGHSLGEVSAYLASGALSFTESVKFAHQRGKLMTSVGQKANGEASLVVDVSPEILEELILSIHNPNGLAISGYNSEKQAIVVGDEEGLETLDQAVSSVGGQLIPFRMIPMKDSKPFHSRFVEKSLEELNGLVQKLTISDPTIPVYSTVSGNKTLDKEEVKENLIQQLISPVLWLQALRKLEQENNTCLIDIGPNKIMKNLVLENSIKQTVFAYDVEEDYAQVKTLV